MKQTFKTAATALLAVMAILAVSCGGNANNKQSADNSTEAAQTQTKAEAEATTVRFVSAEANLASAKSAKIDIEFDKGVSGLMTREVTSDVGEVSIVQCGSGDTKYWTVSVTGLSAPQEVTLTIKKKNYTFSPASRTVTVTPNM